MGSGGPRRLAAIAAGAALLAATGACAPTAPAPGPATPAPAAPAAKSDAATRPAPEGEDGGPDRSAPPSDAERRQVEQQKATLEDRGRAADELRAMLPQLASEDRREAAAARDRFFERADAAVAVLADAVRQGEPRAARAAVETLARLNRPRETAPLLVEVLGRAEQKALWPDAVRALEASGGEGAGGALLDLAHSTQDPEQRAAALGALARASDPPLQAAAALLPWMARDGPELPAALDAFARTVAVHRLHDVATGRGWDVELSPEARAQLDALPERLAQVMARGAGEAAAAARRVAILTRQVPADPLSGVRVAAYSAELQESPAGAALDGQWNTTDVARMWRHPASKPGSLVLDLGQERTVCGVRIWNLNEAGAPQRGWKEAAVYVGDSPAELTVPAAAGQLPPSPGAADVPDYSVTIPVDFRRGRYVRLRALGLLGRDQTGGLTEVQVLGY